VGSAYIHKYPSNTRTYIIQCHVRSVHYARDSGNEYKHIGNNDDDNNNFRDPDDLWVVIAAPRKPVSSGGARARA